jgi:excinuclease ABC subunit A
LIATLLELRNRGNTVVVVEHDEETMLHADHIIELGPQAGAKGGQIMFQGTPQACMQSSKSLTGLFLSKNSVLSRDHYVAKKPDKWITIKEAKEHNLKGVTAHFPVGLFTCVCGVSGSGKSTLVNDILGNAAALKLNRAKTIPGRHKLIEGFDHFESVVRVDQEPIGRSARSNPATYVKIFDLLRELFSECPLSRIRGYKPSRFSFNLRGGRCERCLGEGSIRLDMLFLGEVYTECPSCHGKRYNRETLEVLFKGHTISSILDLTVQEAIDVFQHQPRILDKLNTLKAVGLGYLKLGQSSDTLSGGEAQRLKLSLELSRRQQGRTLYILDEPTTGLHWEDIQKLLDLLFRLRDAGNTIIVIEHHIDVIRLADWVVELGPNGGKNGGSVVYQGIAKDLVQCKDSLTAKALKAYLKTLKKS